jgi:putative oxidoreductase
VAAPILLIAGVWTRLAGAVVAINMLVAVALAHTGDLAKLSKTGGWALELQGMFLLAAVVIALIGAGRWSLAGPKGRFN